MEFRDNQRCFVCGKHNPDGLHLDFEPDGTAGVRTTYTIPERFQGFAGLAHGGILATILDECMVNTLWLRGVAAVTARFEVRLRRPVPVGQQVIFRAHVVRASAKGFTVESRAELSDGTVVAESQGLLVKVAAEATRMLSQD
jgi:acyl-coenzyme A thioesterase PaaI-like protein